VAAHDRDEKVHRIRACVDGGRDDRAICRRATNTRFSTRCRRLRHGNGV
jgi:hypothetical protein